MQILHLSNREAFVRQAAWVVNTNVLTIPADYPTCRKLFFRGEDKSSRNLSSVGPPEGVSVVKVGMCECEPFLVS